MSWWDSADDSGDAGSDAGGYDGLSGNELDNAASDSSASWGQADYGEQQGYGGFDTAFGWDTPKDVASVMAGAGFSDQDISEALANQGVGWLDRAALIGPFDAMTQGDFTRGLSNVLGGALVRSNPIAGLAGTVADQYQRGSMTGNYGGLGGLLGGLAGSRLGGTIGADIGGNMQSALLGLGLGGIGGRALGAAIGSGQHGSSQPRDISGSSAGDKPLLSAAQPQQVQPMQRTQSIAPLMLGGLSSQPAMTYNTGRRFGIV